jgi:hypothetical protein
MQTAYFASYAVTLVGFDPARPKLTVLLFLTTASYEYSQCHFNTVSILLIIDESMPSFAIDQE